MVWVTVSPGMQCTCLFPYLLRIYVSPLPCVVSTSVLAPVASSALRVIEDSDPESSGEEAEAPQDAIDELLAAVDKQVFDPDQLYDSFGPFDAMTAQFVSDFVADLDGSITDLGKALETESYPTARDIAHAMKGAAASVGAVRMGQIMSDIQDRLDDNDPDTAALFCQLLPQTLEELKVVVEPLNHRFLG